MDLAQLCLFKPSPGLSYCHIVINVHLLVNHFILSDHCSSILIIRYKLMSASCINEYNECNKGYLIPHEGTTSRLIVIPTYICLVISYDTDLVFCLCIYTFNKFNQSINQYSCTYSHLQQLRNSLTHC